MHYDADSTYDIIYDRPDCTVFSAEEDVPGGKVEATCAKIKAYGYKVIDVELISDSEAAHREAAMRCPHGY